MGALIDRRPKREGDRASHSDSPIYQARKSPVLKKVHTDASRKGDLRRDCVKYRRCAQVSYAMCDDVSCVENLDCEIHLVPSSSIDADSTVRDI